MLKSVAKLLYPPACFLCHRYITTLSALFCEACERAMPQCLSPVCQRCGVSLSGAYDAQLWCTRCQEHPLAFERARAPFLYIGMVREAIHAFKYHGRRRIGLWLAANMARTAVCELSGAEIGHILPVPMHWLKARLKGTNPSAFLAQTVANLLRIPCDLGRLRRVRWTPSQTRLGLHQRFRNVQGAFQVRRRGVNERAVLLIDDVLTSGATAHACALALREAGVGQVCVLTAACAPQQP